MRPPPGRAFARAECEGTDSVLLDYESGIGGCPGACRQCGGWKMEAGSVVQPFLRLRGPLPFPCPTRRARSGASTMGALRASLAPSQSLSAAVAAWHQVLLPAPLIQKANTADKRDVTEQQEIIREFLIESGENLNRLGPDIVELEKRPADTKLLASVFRTVTRQRHVRVLGFFRP